MNPWRWVDPRARSVRVADVKTYVLDRGWTLKSSPNPKVLIFEKPPADGTGPLLQVMPSSEGFSDYPRHIAEFLTTLSEIEDRHPVDLLNDVLAQAPQVGTATGGDQNGPGASAASAVKVRPRKQKKPGRSP
jgi:hypothetical protein